MRTLTLFWWETLLLRRCLKQVSPDLVHAWGTERGTALVASRLHSPYLVTMQGLLGWYVEHLNLGAYMQLDAMLEKISLRRARLVTVESSFGVKWLHAHYPRLEIVQAEHAPNPMFLDVARDPQLHPIRFLHVGVLSFRKGTDLLLRALAALISELDFNIVLVGSIEQKMWRQLQTEIPRALWQRVELHEHLSPEQLVQQLARATMVLFPTRVDNSPNAVKEAVVAGVPVIASETGGIGDYVLSGRNGLTFQPGDLDALIKAIRQAAVHPSFSHGRVDPDTWKLMRDYLSPKKMGERFVDAYKRLLLKPAQPRGNTTASSPGATKL